MSDDIRKLTEKERDELAQTALKNAEQSRERSKAYRERKKAKGMTLVSIWVPSDRAKSLKKVFEDHVRKLLEKKDVSGK